MFHFGDAPAHGRAYWDPSYYARYGEKRWDRFPDGCPNGHDARKLLERIYKQLEVQYFFAKIDADTDIMIAAFDKELKTIEVLIYMYNISLSN